MFREKNQVNLVPENPIICLFFLPAVVFGKAHPGSPEDLVCNSKNKVKFLIKNKNNQKKVAKAGQECFHYINKSVKLQI